MSLLSAHVDSLSHSATEKGSSPAGTTQAGHVAIVDSETGNVVEEIFGWENVQHTADHG